MTWDKHDPNKHKDIKQQIKEIMEHDDSIPQSVMDMLGEYINEGIDKGMEQVELEMRSQEEIIKELSETINQEITMTQATFTMPPYYVEYQVPTNHQELMGLYDQLQADEHSAQNFNKE